MRFLWLTAGATAAAAFGQAQSFEVASINRILALMKWSTFNRFPAAD
jgi:hypothetical protein